MAIVRRSISEREESELCSGSGILDGKIVMGIDPGTNLMGYGIVKVEGGESRCLLMGVIRPGKFSDRYAKLRHIFERVTALVEQYSPDEVALEAPFYGNNVQSMLKLGRAQGVAMAAALVRDIPVFEYAPTRVKESITGRGRASKEQVASLLAEIMGLKEVPVELDATDALAVAMCHVFARTSPAPPGKGKAGGWESYVNQNPNKVHK